jgi:DcaP outer membrane protein
MIQRMNSVTRVNFVAVVVALVCAANANAQTAPAAATPDPAPAPTIQSKSITPNAIPNTRFMFSGFIKLDALFTKADDGEIPDDTAGRDFYLPSATPVGSKATSEGVDFKMHAKQSRIIFGTDTDLADKSVISSRFEFDLYGSTTGNQRATNTYAILTRQAYLQYKGWLAGQAWSNFQEVGALPETADYIGPTDGTVFVRQAQVRYTTGNFSFSAENPETTITQTNGTQISSDDGPMPDLTAAYNFKFGNGSNVRVAALARQLKYEVASATPANNINESVMAGGISVGGKIVAGSKNDIRFMATYGKGINRYLSLNFANDAVLTSATANLASMEAITGFGAFAAWRHAWTPTVRTTLMYALQGYDNDTQFTGAAYVNKGSNSVAANLFFSPTPKLDVGFEVRVAKREQENNVQTQDGSLKRLEITTKYSF